MNDAVIMLTNYNTRLAEEMEDRRRVAQMLRDFTQAQRELLAQAERTQEVGSIVIVTVVMTGRLN